MAGNRTAALAARHDRRRPPGARRFLPTGFVGVLGICLTTAFATSLAGGRETEDVSDGPSTAACRRLPSVASCGTEIEPCRASLQIQRHRRGFFQRLKFSGDWLARPGEDDLGIGTLKTSLTCAVPLGSFQNLLLITPGFEVVSLDGATQFDAPSRLYDVGVDFMWRAQLSDRWGTMLAVRPAIASDFQARVESFRITGRALATWKWVPDRLSLTFGVVYLDRDDLPILPGAGLVWTPTPDWRFNVLFPRPKLARRLAWVPGRREDWVYLSGSLGGRTWAVRRRSGAADQLTLRDYRLGLGLERIFQGGSGAFAEVGYVFGRELEYEKSTLDRSFEDTVMLRGGVMY